MIKLLICVFITLALAPALTAQNTCIVADLDSFRFLIREGNCDSRASPCETFDIALSLMGYNSAILQDETTPEWAYMDLYKTWNCAWNNSWGKPQNPETWMENSCLWYSQLLTKQMGMNRLQKYVDAFDYGNKDLSGEPGRNDGLTHSWLSSSLKISPQEQLTFLKKLLRGELPASKRAHEMTECILFMEELKEGWELYGKAGSGLQRNADGSINRDRQIGWFVGWLEHPTGTAVFAFLIQDTEKISRPAGVRAKIFGKEKLFALAPALAPALALD